MSPGMEGSRSGGLIASTWASMVSLGREGYREHAREIFETAAAMMDVVRSHPELRIMGDGTSGAPTFCFSFTSDDFEIYHLVDFLGPKGWRFNGQQYPNAIHMAVTRPQTRARGRRGVRGRPGRRDRVRQGEAGRGRGGVRRRDLRRRGRRPRSGDVRLHRRGDGRHARQAASPASGMSDAAGDLVLAVDLGTGGPKVGLRHGARRGALVGAHAGADASSATAARGRRTPSSGGR